MLDRGAPFTGSLTPAAVATAAEPVRVSGIYNHKCIHSGLILSGSHYDDLWMLRGVQLHGTVNEIPSPREQLGRRAKACHPRILSLREPRLKPLSAPGHP